VKLRLKKKDNLKWKKQPFYVCVPFALSAKSFSSFFFALIAFSARLPQFPSLGLWCSQAVIFQMQFEPN
jgi:hypothetical protein